MYVRYNSDDNRQTRISLQDHVSTNNCIYFSLTFKQYPNGVIVADVTIRRHYSYRKNWEYFSLTLISTQKRMSVWTVSYGSIRTIKVRFSRRKIWKIPLTPISAKTLVWTLSSLSLSRISSIKN